MRVLLLSLVSIAACIGNDGDAASSTATDDGAATDDAAGASSTASGSADSSAGTGGGAHYHPEGFAAADVHGPAMKLHAEDCRVCHGADLKGGNVEVSCDGCHQDEWRTDCVYCHGGGENATGAPPRDIDGITDAALLTFIAHPRHVSIFQHAAYDCDQCHRKPVDVLSEGHVFDDTDERAEVDFSAGLSPQAQWDGAGACSSLYCHGNGLAANGSYEHDQPTPTCGGCHPFPGTENVLYAMMSGEHSRHMGEGFTCTECHDPVAIEKHVDGAKDVLIATAGVTWDATQRRCTGLCHLKAHTNEGW